MGLIIGAIATVVSVFIYTKIHDTGFFKPEKDMNPNAELFSEEKESSSWQILEDSVPQKYYLSPAICSRFLRLAQTTDCPPPEPVEYLLIKQGGKYPSSAPFRNGVCGVPQNQEISLLSSQVSDDQMNLFQLCWQKQSI